jgi:hypothetical protein
MLITLLIVAVASLMLNVYQWAERRNEKKENRQMVEELALLESKHQELTDTYNNEKLHREWAMGRIKDQQAVIDQLKSNKPVYYNKQKKNQ